VPNLFDVIDGGEAIQIMGQHEKMREAVFLYYQDTSTWPTEWAGLPRMIQANVNCGFWAMSPAGTAPISTGLSCRETGGGGTLGRA
jgi:hypothetical protein